MTTEPIHTTDPSQNPVVGRVIAVFLSCLAVVAVIVLWVTVAVAKYGPANTSTGPAAAPAATPAATPAARVELPGPALEAPTTDPVTDITPGLYEVGTGAGRVLPGRYRSTGPAEDRLCYWARRSSTDGLAGEIIANQVTEGPNVMTVKASDKYIEVSGCRFIKS